MNLPRVTRGIWGTEARRSEGCQVAIELGVVEEVEELHPELQGGAFLFAWEGNTGEIYEERGIPIVDALTVDKVAGAVAELSVGTAAKAAALKNSLAFLGPLFGFPMASAR